MEQGERMRGQPGVKRRVWVASEYQIRGAEKQIRMQNVKLS